MFVCLCFLDRYYNIECIDFMYDSIKILYLAALKDASVRLCEL